MSSDKDDLLWKAVSADIAPLKKPARIIKTEPDAPKPAKAVKKITRQPPAAAPGSESTKAHPSAGLDRRTREKIRKGKMAIEATLDLHGLSQSQAHAALDDFIRRSFARGLRGALVITGKGRGPDGKLRDPLSPGEGVLRKRVPEWLSTPPLGDMVLEVREAQPAHGGAGALYVYLRRNRDEDH